MHEYSIVQALLERVEIETRARHATAVHRVAVRIGELAGVEPELLRAAYELFREPTICRHAELEIESVSAEWGCPRCAGTRQAEAPLRCPRCNLPLRLTRGDEILLNRIEMEVA